MTPEEYSLLFHRAQVNLVAFKQVFHCDDELRKMVEMAVAAEREACAKVCEDVFTQSQIPFLQGVFTAETCVYAIRARGETK